MQKASSLSDLFIGHTRIIPSLFLRWKLAGYLLMDKFDLVDGPLKVGIKRVIGRLIMRRRSKCSGFYVFAAVLAHILSLITRGTGF